MGFGLVYLNLYAYFIEPIAPVDCILDEYYKEVDTVDKVNKKLDDIYKGKKYDKKGEEINIGCR